MSLREILLGFEIVTIFGARVPQTSSVSFPLLYPAHPQRLSHVSMRHEHQQ